MPSQKSEILETSLRIIKEKPGVFKALEEFEKTGKARIKTRLNFTIDRVLANQFREYCRKHNLNMSKAVEDFIRTKYNN
jgi:hypothetical protein